MYRGDELPTTHSLAKLQMGSQDTFASIQVPLGIFDVDVVDAISKLLDKGGGIEKLRDKMAWIKVNPKTRAAVNCIERVACRLKIVGESGGLYFEGKRHDFPFN